ncbi:siderophore-interacting protein [Streptomyces sp. SHP 1-2]|uniref:siderophore-interacting protein n=1 Tax=Streptomyces sp. SHP 1-2 TaxID=2769489 RepID=UPI00223807FA|nr:siderophore-interacting protein [Streptomyces sp. SHP 1-2]MCW5252021.1 siderophore-interacting protein [Streptomyces sp. SHP 1-2]
MADDTPAARLPADYVPRIHRAEVTGVERTGPGMVRVRFGGSDLRDYPTTGTGDEYVRMFFPDRPGDEVRLPRITTLRGWEYPDGVEPSAMRVYTVRDHAPGRLTVDFVVHDGGVAAAWARRARPGDAVGVNPPCGLYERPGTLTRQLLVADEPGLPAALRLAELTADEVRTTLLVEVRGPAHRVRAGVGGVDYLWLDGSGNGVGESRLLDALRELAPGHDTYVWVATEGRLNRAVRRYLRHERGLPAHHYKCVAYWQERAEAWRARYEELGPEFASKARAVRTAEGRDPEEIADEMDGLYEAAGL